jgi:hypothetical protein
MDEKLRLQTINQLSTTFFANKQPLACAILLADSAREGSTDPGLWVGLGAGLMGSAGVLVRKPFIAAADKAFARARPLAEGTPFAEVIDEWMPAIEKEREGAAAGPMKDDELDPLLDFLHVTDQVMIEAVEGLPANERMFALIVLRDRADERYFPLLCEAASGTWGPEVARSAYKGLYRYRDRKELHVAVEKLRGRGLFEECRVYVNGALGRDPSDGAGGGSVPRSPAPSRAPVAKTRAPASPARGLPGGIVLPAIVFVASMTTFMVCWTHPDLINFGTAIGRRINPAGVGVTLAAIALFWLLIAIAKRPPRTP